MNKRIKKLWVKALRSGKYKQGTGALKSSDTADGIPVFCCLGVLCDLHAKSTGGHWRDDYYLSDSGTLPLAVIEWADIPGKDDDPRLGPRRTSKRAAATNDSGKNFNYIADRIEKYL